MQQLTDFAMKENYFIYFIAAFNLLFSIFQFNKL